MRQLNFLAILIGLAAVAVLLLGNDIRKLRNRVDDLEKRVPVYTTNAVQTFRNASTP